MSVRFCRECGARMMETDKFCFNCGTPATPAPQPVPVTAVMPEPSVSAPAAESPTPIPFVAPHVTDPVPMNDTSSVAHIPELPPQPTYAPPAEPVFTPTFEPSYQPPLQTPAYPPSQEPSYAPLEEPDYGPVYTPPYAQPAQPAPQAPAKPAKPPKAPKPVKPLPKRKVLNILGCILVCILLVAIILPTVLLVDLRMMAEDDRILEVLESVDLDAMPAKDIFIDIDDERTMLDWACDYMNQNFSEAFHSGSYHWSGIQSKNLENFLDDSTFLELTAGTMSGLLTDMIEGTSKTSLDAKEIETFLKDNSKFLEKEFSLNLNQDSRKLMAQQTMDMLKVEELSLDTLPELPGDALTIAGSALSTLTLILMGGLVALLILLLFLMSRKYIMAGVHDTGLVFLISGIMLLALTGGARVLVSLFAGENAVLYLVGILAGGLLESGLLISLCIFAFGMLLLLISGITLSILRKRAAKA